jgi:hypothetical protein
MRVTARRLRGGAHGATALWETNDVKKMHLHLFYVVRWERLPV